ncbi:gephyrin-like molybdotransferase Glp [Halospeciosus flavus]|uniref:Gephyrin-like molybdotransferase Glp n=1 Tax=Halospeciosus flavus TaxID=3032283 RepID=A0ABD5Z8L3_9EURY|nr:gephyrin-like molybdotransferase Glp [Halospeciosus flavus]
MTHTGDRHHAGFKERTRVADARDALRDAVDAHGRTERAPLTEADGRTLAATVTAERNVPHYDRAAMDGYAVRAEDTFGASDRSPAVLDRYEADEDATVGPGEAVRVHTGSALPEGADAVVMIEQVEEVGREVEVFTALAEGKNVGDVGEDVEAGQHLYDPGHRLRPSDLGMLRSVGVDEVEVYQPPEVAVIPTGEELVEAGETPDPGEVVETNGLTVSRFVERWGGEARYRDVVTDDEDKLREALERDRDADVLVTTGGSSVGERDLIPEVVDELGEVLVHGVALKPGHPVALGVVDGTPVVMLPGYPVACIINAVQFLRPALKWAGGMSVPDFPSTQATLTRKIPSEPGVRTFARVQVSEEEGETVAEPVRTSGSGILSSVALADGWVQVPEESEGIAEGKTVTVEKWEELP